MPNLKALHRLVNSLRGDTLFSAGIVGVTSQLQSQTTELKNAFGRLQAKPKDKKLQKEFRSALFSAHVVSVITDEELEQCLAWLEER